MQNFLVTGDMILISVSAVSLVFSFILTPFARETARRAGILDIPRDGRRMHVSATPLMGGAAIIISFILTLTLFFIVYGGSVPSKVILIILGAVLCGAFGIADDIFTLRPIEKLGFQTVLALYSATFVSRIEAFSLFGETFYLRAFSFPLTVFWIVFMMNAINLTDGMDGLASGISAVCSFALSVMLFIAGERNFSVLAACLCGACLGFLVYNANPASVFMGETGSAFLGFVLSTLSTRLFSVESASGISGAVLVFMLPITETVSSFFRRAVHGKNPLQPDKKHIHHLLYNLGFSVPHICFILYAFTAASAFCAVIYPEYGAVSSIIFACSVVFMRLILEGNGKKSKKRREPL